MGRVISRTRSLRKMKLPLSSPNTSNSPVGYSAVISAPSSFTRRAMVGASYTIRRSVRPSRRGSTGNALTDVVSYRSPGPLGCRIGAAHSWNPDDVFPLVHDDGPTNPLQPAHSRFGEIPLHPTRSLTTGLAKPVSGRPRPDDHRLKRRQLGTPRF